MHCSTRMIGINVIYLSKPSAHRNRSEANNDMPRLALKALRRAYAEELRVAGPVRNNPKVIEAFATVPRENFLPPGPWTLHGIATWRTPNADPAWVSHNVLDQHRRTQRDQQRLAVVVGLSVRSPETQPGERVLQVGSGNRLLHCHPRRVGRQNRPYTCYRIREAACRHCPPESEASAASRTDARRRLRLPSRLRPSM